MRSRQEIAFRLRQEAGNAWMAVSAPRGAADATAPLHGLPSPRVVAEALRDSAYAAEVERAASDILQHRFPLLGLTIETGQQIEWRRDYLSGIVTPARYFRRIPYLDAQRAGDHKVVWELNRHQHWVLLAQAFLFTGRREFPDEISAEYDSWSAQNPFLRGINWTSALEVAFRALSWIWTYHLAGEAFDPALRARLLTGLYRHGCYLERNLSVYFSPNTHLLGEAVALHALGVLFPGFDGAQRWARTGARIVREQMDRQVREDGSHFEQSTYYHVYALDMFAFHAVLSGDGLPAAYRAKLARMADYLRDLMGPERRLSFLGDDDGGRFFHPYGPRDRFGRATLATASALLGSCEYGANIEDCCEQAAWWLGPDAVRAAGPARFESRLYRDSGIAVITDGATHILADAGGFGAGSAGHSHSDTLSLTVRHGGAEILIDPGTYTYMGDPAWRDRFRGSAAHNTVRVDERDQAIPAGPFRWLEPPRAAIRRWSTSGERDYLEAAVTYRGVEHLRRVLFLKPEQLLVILDEVAGPEGEHLVEQFWHAGAEVNPAGASAFRIGDRAVFALAAPADFSEGGEYGWRSEAPGRKTPAPVIRVGRITTLPVCMAAVVDLNGCDRAPDLSILQVSGPAIELQVDSGKQGIIRFLRSGEPEYTLSVPRGS